MILIKLVLLSLPMYTLAAMDPPKAVLNRIETICANFLWGEGDYGHKYHWVAWKKCCFPINEGGLGIRRIHDIVTAFSMKLWWQIRTKASLWTDFMKNKYSYEKHLTDCSWKGGTSPIWQRLMKIKDCTEANMRWVLGRGDIDFWKEKW